MEMRSKVLSLLGIAMKGRRIVSGEFQTLEAVRSGQARAVLVAEDASENTGKLFRDKCQYYQVPLYVFGTKEELGRAIGKDLRASLAVCDPGLAAAVGKHLDVKSQVDHECLERSREE